MRGRDARERFVRSVIAVRR